MAGCLSPSEVEKLLSGDMPEAERARAEAHLGECATCSQLLKSQRADGALFSDLKIACRADSATVEAGFDSPEARSRPGPLRKSSSEEIEGFEILSEIRRGGQGVVYKAIQVATKRVVALKLLLAGSFATQRQRDRFQREINLAASLRHPNIVTIYESGITSAGCPYFAMEYVDGPSLDAYLESHELSSDDLLRLFRRICSAVGYAHGGDVIHRDLKPGNIRIDSDGEPHVLDFGLAKIAGPGSSDEVSITGTGEFMGTLAYASPEQSRGHSDEIDHRTDVYSLGVILYRMLTSRFPYPVEGAPAEVLKHIAETGPAPPSSDSRTINNELETVVFKALDKDVSRRYQSVDEFGEDIERFLAGEPVRAKRDSRAYVLRKRSRKLISQHRFATTVGLIAASIILLQLVIETFSRNWLNDRFAKVVMALMARPSTPFENVRIIEFSDKTEPRSLAQEAGLRDVDRGKSLRRLHGRLMEILAPSDARVVVFDIAFLDESPFDSDFVKGVEALRARGTKVIVATERWWADAPGIPEVSPVIRRADLRYGCIRLKRESYAPWEIMLVMQRGGREPLLSLSLAAVSAYFEDQNTRPRITVEHDPPCVKLAYHNSNANADEGEFWNDDMTQALSSLDTWSGSPKHGLREGDWYGTYIIQLPSNAVLDAATIEYADVFHAGQNQLKTWFRDQVVVVADETYKDDFRPTPDGRQLGGYHAHAVAMQAMIQEFEHPIPRPARPRSGAVGEKLVSALFGLMTALIAGRRRWIVLAAWLVVYAGACLGLAVMYHFLWNPFVPFCALVIACELTASIRRVQGGAPI